MTRELRVGTPQGSCNFPLLPLRQCVYRLALKAAYSLRIWVRARGSDSRDDVLDCVLAYFGNTLGQARAHGRYCCGSTTSKELLHRITTRLAGGLSRCASCACGYLPHHWSLRQVLCKSSRNRALRCTQNCLRPSSHPPHPAHRFCRAFHELLSVGLCGRQSRRGESLLKEVCPRYLVQQVHQLEGSQPSKSPRNCSHTSKRGSHRSSRCGCSSSWPHLPSRQPRCTLCLLTEGRLRGRFLRNQVSISPASWLLAFLLREKIIISAHSLLRQVVHEGRLAGTVLAEQGVDLAGRNRQIDALVGDDTRKALGD